MKSYLASCSLFAATALAQFNFSSPPFELAIISDNSTYNGTILGACHEGAGIEGLCPSGYPVGSNSTYTNFYTRTYEDNSTDTQSKLMWDLHYGDNSTAPSAMHFSTDWTSSLVIPIIYPGDVEYTLVFFASDGYLYLPRYQDTDVDPPAYLDPVQKIENWYLCTTHWSYVYITLAWAIGNEKPKNPSCQKVRIKRVFV